MVTITAPVCQFCHTAGTIELTEEEANRLKTVRFIQDALPDRTDDERELLISGTHPECWNAIFPPEDED